MFNNFKFLVQYILSELLEIIAHGLCIKLLPLETLNEFKGTIYDMPIKIYVDIFIFTMLLVFLELPMFVIRNKIWNKFCKNNLENNI